MPGSPADEVRDQALSGVERGGPGPVGQAWPGTDTPAPAPAQRSGRWGTRITVALLLVVGAVVVAWLLALVRLQDVVTTTERAVELGTADAGAGPVVPDGPPPDPAAGALPGAEPPAAGAGADPAWVTRTAAAAGLPERALQAYAAAELRTRQEDPECGLSWGTLAGIGWVESRHGTIGGNSLGPDGRPAAGPIVGVALTGEGSLAAVPDTDGGTLDGDATWDRAVGPLQFIPGTWARWGIDADGDGASDPQDVDDASLAAARYLCASGSPLTDPARWREAVLSYNRSEAYVGDVLQAADFYARRSLSG
ncbi:MAG: lytic transglycosylase domain-containing protein [Kineosporiaceae bacterium]